uniref:COP9 signalosome complex subunit 8 n=1 Tax=Molossus molossus TaxID=27622 RepID=A0A7J8FQJ3_MOLMO|nr:COP9 signalosome subunit 8 [Molossus molossus]
MPVAVMAENAFSFKKLLDQCENQELEAPGGIATPPVYGQLLALYLLHNDMNNARYLWKRIPPAIKSANSELGGIWSVGQRIWQRDFPGIYTTIGAHQWSETVQPIMEALREATRRRAFALVSQAYTSIVADDFAAFVGLPVEEAVKGVAGRLLLPRRRGCASERGPGAHCPAPQGRARCVGSRVVGHSATQLGKENSDFSAHFALGGKGRLTPASLSRPPVPTESPPDPVPGA